MTLILAGTHFFIRQLRVRSLLPTGVTQHGYECAKSEVVVVLFGELLHRQRIQREHFLRQELGVVETLSKQNDLGDQVRIWDHHRDGPEHGLQVVRQLRTAGITWNVVNDGEVLISE